MTDLVPVSDDLDATPPPAVAFVDQIRHLVMVGDVERRKLAEAGDVEGLAWGLVRLKQVRQLLSDLLTEVEADVFALMPEKKRTVIGVGTLEKRTGSARKKWESTDLVKHLIRLALDPDQTGEIPSSPVEAVDQVVSVLTECAPFTPSMQWRATALRDRGVDPDDWCEVSPGRQSVQIHGEVDQ